MKRSGSNKRMELLFATFWLLCRPEFKKYAPIAQLDRATAFNWSALGETSRVEPAKFGETFTAAQ
jgi:hypothetical protein